MNKHQFEGVWHQYKGQIKKKWGEMTDNELTQINGNAERLCGILQKKYGYTKDKADQEVEAFLNGLKRAPNDPSKFDKSEKFK